MLRQTVHVFACRNVEHAAVIDDRATLRRGTLRAHLRRMPRLFQITRSDLRSVLLSGFFAGFISLLLAMLIGSAASPAGVSSLVRMEAAMLLGPVSLEGNSLSTLALTTGLGVHFGASLLFATLIDRVVGVGLPLPPAATGGVCAVVLYLFNFYALIALFPWFAAGRGLAMVAVHVAFGVVAGATFQALHRERLERGDPITP